MASCNSSTSSPTRPSIRTCRRCRISRWPPRPSARSMRTCTRLTPCREPWEWSANCPRTSPWRSRIHTRGAWTCCGRAISTRRCRARSIRWRREAAGFRSVERQLPKNIALAVTYTHSRGVDMLRSRNINAPLPGTFNPLAPGSGVFPYGDVGNIYLYESSGLFTQNQLITNINARINAKLNLFGYYALGKAESNTDGAGTFPSNQYNEQPDWGRAGFDVRNRIFIGGSVVAPLGLRFSPFIIAQSGSPFDITTGQDMNGDSIFNDRPAFATNPSAAGVGDRKST